MSPLLRSGLATSQDRICFHSPSKGLSGCAASPVPVFSAPVLGTGYGTRRQGRERSSIQEVFPQYNSLRKRRGGRRPVRILTEFALTILLFLHQKQLRCLCNQRLWLITQS